MLLSFNNREEWLAARQQYLGASDAAAMLGEDEYKTAEQLRMQKSGLADEFNLGEPGRIRELMESVVCEVLYERHGWEFTRPKHCLYIDDACPLLAATPDAIFTCGTKLLEIKVVRSMPQDKCEPTTKSGKPSTQAFLHGPPLRFQIQQQQQMACCGPMFTTNILGVLHLTPDLTVKTYETPRNDKFISTLRTRAVEFWKGVTALREGRVAV